MERDGTRKSARGARLGAAGSVWERAIELVDNNLGYSIESADDPEAHYHLWEQKARELMRKGATSAVA